MQVSPQSGSFAHGLCECCNGECSTCLMGCYIPCVLAGQNAEALDIGSCPLYTFAGCCHCLCLSCIFGIKQREIIRQKYNIKGTGCTDCCEVFWCYGCIMVQHRNTMVKYGDYPKRRCANPTVVVVTNQPVSAQPSTVTATGDTFAPATCPESLEKEDPPPPYEQL